ncbi:MAG TPA: Holliday junction branch migration protein RuvA [Bdellovibrionota bacterium]|nr:Holliday junction branch migration protein RuvA [Bdellovibrionota bacterium]
MIAYLRGQLLHRDLNEIVVDVQGVGYCVAVSLQTACRLPDKGQLVEIFIHTHVREDQLDLYGFLTEKERRLYRMLLTVNGIGAKSAITILSGMSVDDLIQTITFGEVTRLTKIPGIGSKTAERIVLELQQKFAKIWPRDMRSTPFVRPNIEEDVISALINLGYKAKEAESAVDRALKNASQEWSFNDLLKQTLNSMG